MHFSIDRKLFLRALDSVSTAVPSKSPKPILQHVKLIVNTEGDSILIGTDMEIGIRYNVMGIKANSGGEVALPMARLREILSTSDDQELTINVDSDKIQIRGKKSKFSLPTEDVILFPDVPDFESEDYYIVTSDTLLKSIRRTIFAINAASANYATGGVWMEFGSQFFAAATDMKRMATCCGEFEVCGSPSKNDAIMPPKGLKLLTGLLEPNGPPIHVYPMESGVLFRTGDSTVYSRVLDGKFPEMVKKLARDKVVQNGIEIPLDVRSFLTAISQAAILTSEETRSVNFRLSDGTMKLVSSASQKGSGEVELEIEYGREDHSVNYDWRYIQEPLRILDDGAVMKLNINPANNMGTINTNDGYYYSFAPMVDQ